MYKTTTGFLGSFCSQQKPKPPVSGLHSFAYATTNNINHTLFIFIQSNTFRLLAILSHSLIHSVCQTNNQPIIQPTHFISFISRFLFSFSFFFLCLLRIEVYNKKKIGEVGKCVFRYRVFFLFLLLSSHCWFILSST